MGHSAEHQTNTARRLLVAGCVTGIGAASERLLASDGIAVLGVGGETLL
jgi:hypothetical protein